MDTWSLIISAIADTANTVSSIINTYYQLEAAKKSEKQARELAMLAREDQLRQNAIQNALQQQQLELSKLGFNWEKLKWGQTWGLTKQQYIDQRDAQAAAARRQRALDVANTVTSGLAAQNQQYNQTISRMGV